MHLLFAAIIASQPFCDPQPWALDFAAPPRWPYVGDVNSDGYPDLVVVYPEGNVILDVSLNQKGQKSGRPYQGLPSWKPGIQAAAVGDYDGRPGADVAGIFGGNTIRLASGQKSGFFEADPAEIKLPDQLSAPFFLESHSNRLIVASPEGKAFEIDWKGKTARRLAFPPRMRWASADDPRWAMRENGQMGSWTDSGRFEPLKGLVNKNVRSVPSAYREIVSYGGRVIVPGGKSSELAPLNFKWADDRRSWADIDNDGDHDLVVFRYGTEKHWAYSVVLYRAISGNEPDADGDGLTNDEEDEYGSNPYNADSDADGLLDGWEVKGFRGLDLKGLGCSPMHTDLICYISPFEGVDEALMKRDFDRVAAYYANLKVANPDGKTGFAWHPIYLPLIPKSEQEKPWWENRDRLLPSAHRGIAHWMQITPSGGGQADQLGDGGGCGGYKGACYATYIHEFGHQLGMDHQGFWEPAWCPTFPSLMNYAYGYSLEDDPAKISYSYGLLKDYILQETNLSEVIPLPYEKIKFLEKGPYRFRLKPQGDKTLIDWNWNGVFGEKKVVADINYGYSTNAGIRDDMDYCDSSPWLLVHNKKAFAVYAQRSTRGNAKDDHSVGYGSPGSLIVRKLVKPKVWEKPFVFEKDRVIGDPVGVSFGGCIWLFYNTTGGVKLMRITEDGKVVGEPMMAERNPSLVPTVGLYKGKLWLYLWNPKDKTVNYKVLRSNVAVEHAGTLEAKSNGPVGMAVDTFKDRIVLGMMQNQDEKRPNRWQVRYYRAEKNELKEESLEWVEGEKGGARGVGRCVLLYERNKHTPKEGRLIFFARGGEPNALWATCYSAMQIGDKSVKGGWLVRMYYDEWSCSRTWPAAAFFNGDIIYAYRWVDGANPAKDNRLHIGYRGSGIDLAPMADHDDIGFFKEFGIRHSIIYLGAE